MLLVCWSFIFAGAQFTGYLFVKETALGWNGPIHRDLGVGMSAEERRNMMERAEREHQKYLSESALKEPQIKAEAAAHAAALAAKAAMAGPSGARRSSRIFSTGNRDLDSYFKKNYTAPDADSFFGVEGEATAKIESEVG